jgi:hypothetical protein
MKRVVCFSLGAIAVLTVTCASAQTKWHPGHYMRVDLERVDRTVSEEVLNSIANEPAVLGVTVGYNWAVLEGATPDSYDFHRIDHQLEVLSKHGKRLMVDVVDHAFGPAWRKFDSTVLPAYLDAPEYGGGWAREAKGGCAKIWLPSVMDRYIALFVAMAKRYDDNPWFEMAGTGETARALDPRPADYSEAGYVTQWSRWAEATRAAWPNTNLWLGANFMARGGKPENLEAIIAACYQQRIAVGGPDIRLNGDNPTLGVKITNGLIGNLGDLRGKIALRTEHQVLLKPTDTPAALYDNAVVQTNDHGLRLNYISWKRKKNAKISDDWDDDVLPFLRTHPNTIGARPTSYEPAPLATSQPSTAPAMASNAPR